MKSPARLGESDPTTATTSTGVASTTLRRPTTLCGPVSGVATSCSVMDANVGEPTDRTLPTAPVVSTADQNGGGLTNEPGRRAFDTVATWPTATDEGAPGALPRSRTSRERSGSVPSAAS